MILQVFFILLMAILTKNHINKEILLLLFNLNRNLRHKDF
jgi:hypothetical protein